MPKIARKISVFGDSISTAQATANTNHIARAAYIAGQPGFGAGYNDFSVGGQRAQDTLVGIVSVSGAPMFGGLNFEQHIKTVDDSDIVLIALGTNDAPFARGTYTGIPSNAWPEDYLGSEFQHIGETIRLMIQHATAAGKRVAVVGMPYFDIAKAISPTGMAPENIVGPHAVTMARGFATRLVGNNVVNRLASGLTGAPFITTYGSPVAAGQPAADSNSVVDGLHPMSPYANAVNAHIAAQLRNVFGL